MNDQQRTAVFEAAKGLYDFLLNEEENIAIVTGCTMQGKGKRIWRAAMYWGEDYFKGEEGTPETALWALAIKLAEANKEKDEPHTHVYK